MKFGAWLKCTERTLIYVRSYHVYQDIREGRNAREQHSICGRYAVAVEKNGIVIGHLPRKVARVWIQKTVDRFQIAQQSLIHVMCICVNKIIDVQCCLQASHPIQL